MRNRAWVAIASVAAVLLVFGVTPTMAASPEGTGSTFGTPGATGGEGPPPGLSGMPRGYTGPPAGGSPGQTKGQMTGLSGGGPSPSGTSRVSAMPSPFHGGQKGGDAVVVSVDQPDNCLRIRRGPSSAYEQIGCAGFGEKLRLTGVFSNDNRWAQLDNNGWVFTGQIRTNVMPPRGGGTAARRAPSGWSQGTLWEEEPAGSFSEDVSGPSYWDDSYYSYPYRHRYNWRNHQRWHGGGGGGWRRGGGGGGGGWGRGGGGGRR